MQALASLQSRGEPPPGDRAAVGGLQGAGWAACRVQRSCAPRRRPPPLLQVAHPSPCTVRVARSPPTALPMRPASPHPRPSSARLERPCSPPAGRSIAWQRLAAAAPRPRLAAAAFPPPANSRRRLRFHPPDCLPRFHPQALARAAADACDLDVTARYCGLTPLELEAVRRRSRRGSWVWWSVH